MLWLNPPPDKKDMPASLIIAAESLVEYVFPSAKATDRIRQRVANLTYEASSKEGHSGSGRYPPLQAFVPKGKLCDELRALI